MLNLLFINYIIAKGDTYNPFLGEKGCIHVSKSQSVIH